jgi:ATP-binding cassette subfamily C protein
MDKIISKIKWIYKYAFSFKFNIFLLVILGSFTSIANIFRAFVFKGIVDSATNIKIKSFIYYLVAFAILIILDLLLQGTISSISTKTNVKLCNKIQLSFYSNLTRIKWLQISRFHSDDILTRITNDADNISGMVINILPNTISSLVLLFGSFLMLLYFDTRLALCSFFLTPLLVLLSKHCSRKLKILYISLQQIEAKCRSKVHESIQNIIIVKSFCLEERNTLNIAELQNEKLKLSMKRTHVNIVYNSLLSIGSYAAFFIVFTWGIFNLANGTATYGTMTALLQLIGNIQSPISKLAASLPTMTTALAAIDRLEEIKNLQREDYFDEDSRIIHPDILIDNVSFNYNKNKSILKNISITIRYGYIIGLIGSSGEGKTTIIRLLLSLIYPTGGHIYLASNNKKVELSPSHRAQISYVPQGNTLFSGTIADNLRCGDNNATEVNLIDSLKSAFAWDFVCTLDNGLYTVIGENGLGLSDGQAQRIAIARALLKKSPILILDEATSALDVETELNVLNSIKNLEHRPTTIIITHRPSALDICDRILKLKSGFLSEIDKTTISETAVETIH